MTSSGKVSSPDHFFSPPGPPVRYGVVKKAVLPCGDPSIVIFTPPIFSRFSYLPQVSFGYLASTFSRSVMNG